MVVTPTFFWQAGLNTVHLKTIELLAQMVPVGGYTSETDQ
jgi:hypothetical protein